MGERTTFPAASEYQAALQNPGFCFSDSGLRTAEPERTALGLPRPVSGNFASVFPVRTPDGRRHALKCFTRTTSDQFTRYEAIAGELNRARPSWAVGMDFHRRGIRVNGDWYPLLRMDWAEAVSLTQWVDRNIGARGRLEAVAARFAGVVRDLEARGMAHGDLQHGNVLIDRRDDVRLVDYDGMYLPSLAAHIPDEVGHPNYQHPDRSPADYSATVDRFSAWLIHLSLRALAADARLWDECNPDHEEYLLLKKADLADPSGSRRVALLRGHADPRVRALADWTHRAHGVPPGRLPALGREPRWERPSPRQDRSPWTPAPPSGASVTGLPPWVASLLADRTGDAAPPSRSGTGSGSPTGGGGRSAAAEPDLARPERLRPVPAGFPVHRGVRWSLRAVLVLLCCSAVVYAVLPGVFAATALSCGLLALPALGGAVRARGRTDLRRSRAEARRDIVERTRALRAARRRIRAAEKGLADVRAKADGLDREYDSRLRKLEREQATRREAAKRSVEELTRARAALGDEEEGEVQRLLARRQAEHMVRRLGQARIRSGDIPGIGKKLVENLHAYGIASAADIQGVHLVSMGGRNSSAKVFFLLANGVSVNVPGIGPAKAQAIEGWRMAHVSAARARQRPWLDHADRRMIRERFAQRERDVDNRIRAAQAELQQLDSGFAHEKDQAFAAYQDHKRSKLAELAPRRSELERDRTGAEREVARLETEVEARRDWLRSAPKSGLVRYLWKQAFR